MKNKTQKKITLLWGLPGSGKTYYALENCTPARGYSPQPRTIHIDVDELWRLEKNYGSGKKLVNVIAQRISDYSHNADSFIVDSLLTTNQAARDIFMAITTLLGDKFELLFEIVWWSPNVEDCLHNDRGRRAVDSRITIENIVFEEPSKELIEEWNMKKRVTRKRVVRKPNWQVWAEESGIWFSKSDKAKDTLKSDTWCLGGTSGSCYGNDLSPVSAGPQPTSFKEFDDLLEKVCPQISFLQYKKLYNHCVTTDTESHGDYYGGNVEYGFYICHLPKLYEMLVKMGIVTT